MDIKKIFGQNVKKYRKAHGFTQIKFAELLNVEQKHISFIESGNSFPSAGLISKIAGNLNVQPADLFSFAPELTVEQMKLDIINVLNTACDKDIEKLHNYAGFICIKNTCIK